jgi:hypothetical protein
MSAAQAPGRAESVALVALLVLCAIWLGLQFEPFLVPNNDWYTFEDAARRMEAGSLPLESKRLPAFPALLAVSAPLLGGEHPELRAALLWNAAFSLASLVLLFRLAARTIGPGAILAPVLFAASVPFHHSGLQPLVEPSLTASVLATFVLFERRSRWQYATAALVALGRYDAATIVPVIALANALWDRAWRRHAALGALALTPLVAWRVAGAWAGVAEGSYLDLMEGMGFAPAPGFAWEALAAAFTPLHGTGPVLLVGIVLAAVPLASGLVAGLRERPRDVTAWLMFFAALVGVVVVFGVPKARYAHPLVWLPALLWALGVRRLLDWTAARLPSSMQRPLAVAGVVLALGATAAGLRVMAAKPHLIAFGWDAGLALGLLAIGAAGIGLGARRTRAPATLVLIALALLVTAGVARKQTALADVHHANHGSALLADWLVRNLPEGEGVVVLNVGAVLYRSGLPEDRVRNFSVLKADSVEELAAAMRAEHLTHVAWTWRPESDSRSAAYYDQRKNVALARSFEAGSVVRGFEHVATLTVPPAARQGDVQVYRLVSYGP